MTSIVYRFEFFTSVFASGILMLSMVFLWRAVYHAVNIVDGLNENQMVTYAILSALLGVIFNVGVERAMYDRVLQGDIAIDFVRPTNIMLCYLAEDIGVAIGSFISKFIPMLVLVSIFFYTPLPVNFVSFILFTVSSALSFGILWLMNAIIGVMHIKLFDLGSIGYIKDAVIALLSGSIIPIWFLPEKIRVVLSFFPFQYTYQTPLGIYIGKYSPYDALVSIIIQGIWICLLLMALNTVWKKFSKKVMVQGG